MYQDIKRNKMKTGFIISAYIIILTLIVSTLIYLEIKNNEVIIPDSAIRLRVIPNSNTSVDQNIKNKVKKY